MESAIEVTRENLLKRGYNVYQCEYKQEIIELIFTKILPSGISEMVIGLGHSETLEDIHLLEILREKFAQVLYHKPPLTSKEDDRKAMLADIYFLSANAVSEDGYIINIDGTGNRIAASCFGPQHVVFVIGKNKIVKTLDAAMDRALNYASIELSKKYGFKLPCTVKGCCTDCFLPGCPCGITTIYRKQLFSNKTSIILVNEDMGI